MALKDRDLDELLKFQKAGMDFGIQITTSASKLRRAVEAARSVLHDRVAERSISKVVGIAEELASLGNHVESEMRTHYQKTVREQEAFSALMGGN